GLISGVSADATVLSRGHRGHEGNRTRQQGQVRCRVRSGKSTLTKATANAARVGPRLRLSRTPAKPIEACRIARSQSNPLRLSGRGRRRGETPECNPFSGLNHVTREVVIGKPDITSSGSRPEPLFYVVQPMQSAM